MKSVSSVLFYALIALLLSACKKDKVVKEPDIIITTGDVMDVYRKGATLSGSIQYLGTDVVTAYGILLAKEQTMSDAKSYIVTDKSTDFCIKAQGLIPGDTYYYCAYANSESGILKGQVKHFSIPLNSVPIWGELTVLEQDENSCKVSVFLEDDGGTDLLVCGFCWTEVGNDEPTKNSQTQEAVIVDQTMTASLNTLKPNQEYLIRAYAENSVGIGYSLSVSMKTYEATVPRFGTVIGTDITATDITLSVVMEEKGTSAITQAGFCWSMENETPTVDDSIQDLLEQLADEKDMLCTALSGLQSGTTYNVRAYAVNAHGIIYSDVFTFTTPNGDAETDNADIDSLPKKEW